MPEDTKQVYQAAATYTSTSTTSPPPPRLAKNTEGKREKKRFLREMKLATKPISSPGRVEKYYPPPVMRFLRSSVGSRRRGRSSRSSPLMFVRKKNIANKSHTSSAETHQEPSSPKVTCMGQVRVRRGAKSSNTTRPGTGGIKPKRRWKWIRNATVCCGKKIKVKPHKSFNAIRLSWPKWGLLFHVKRGKSREEESTKPQQKLDERSEDIEEEEEDEEEKRVKGYVPRSTSPPKNALILTRCRSAPYRSSSLACRFWGSPLGSSEKTEQQKQGIAVDQDVDNGKEESDIPTLKRESLSKGGETNERLVGTEEKTEFLKELEGSITVKVEEFGRTGEATVTLRPVILTRCKSEPARTAAQKLDPETGFWNKRRLGFT